MRRLAALPIPNDKTALQIHLQCLEDNEVGGRTIGLRETESLFNKRADLPINLARLYESDSHTDELQPFLSLLSL